MTIRVLGAISASHLGEPIRLSAAQVRIVALLVAAGPDGLTDDQLADGLWGDDLPRTWHSALRQAISRMRRSYPADAIDRSPGRYALTLSPDQVDLWALTNHPQFGLAATDIGPFTDDRSLRSLLTDEPYPGAAGPQLIATSVDRAVAARVGLLNRLRTEHPERANQPLLAATRGLATTTWSEDLLRAVVELNLACGETSQARAILVDGIDRLEQGLELPVGEALSELRDSLHSRGTITPSAPVARATFRCRPTPPRGTLIERAEVPLDLAAPNNLLISGPSGSGKSVLAQAIADRRHAQGHHVVWIQAQRELGRHRRAAFGPFVAAVPELAEVLERTSPADSASLARTMQWSGLQQKLTSAFTDHHLTLVVDDAQWLDQESSGFVSFLARGAGERVSAIVVARPASGDTDLVTDLRRLGVSEHEAGPFSHAELVELIGAMHSRSTSLQRDRLAALIEERRSALPAIATELVRRLDPETLTAPTFSPVERDGRWTSSVWTGAVSPQTARLGAQAALIGPTWSTDHLVELAGCEAEELATSLDELLDADVVVAQPRPDEFSFRHVLIQEAFAQLLPRSQARSVHRRAADLAAAEGRVHDAARHLASAGPHVETRELTQALLASARTFATQGSHLNAVTTFQAAEQVDGGCLGVADLALLARSVERSGGDAATARQRAFAAAEAAGDAAAMAQVAIDDADLGEMLGVFPERLELLERLPVDRLTRTERFRRDRLLCRELGLGGDYERALSVFAEMETDTPDQLAAAWVAVWTSLSARPPQQWPAVDLDLDAIEDPVLRSRARNIACSLALLEGDRARFEAEFEALASNVAAATDQPTQRWHVLLLRSLRAWLDGDLRHASELADQALTLGSAFGLAATFPARTAQLFAHHWVAGSHDALIPAFEAAPPDVGGSLLGLAGHAAVLFRCGRHHEALERADRVFDALDSTGGGVEPSAAMLLADLAPALRVEEREILRDLLLPHRGSMVLTGADIAHLGPASRGLARLSSDPSERVALLREAVDSADRAELPIHSVRCRLDLADETGDDATREAARRIAQRHGELEEHFFSEP